MKCDDVLVNLPDYVLGMVEPSLKKSIELHLEICTKCKAELSEVARAISILGGIEREEYPDGFWQELKASIMEHVSVPRPARWRVPAFAGGLAVLLLAIGIGIYEYLPKRNQQATSITTLATSLPTEQVAELPRLNVNYVNSADRPIDETGEINCIDDSLQSAIVKSMWASCADSSKSLSQWILDESTYSLVESRQPSGYDFDYIGEVFSN